MAERCKHGNYRAYTGCDQCARNDVETERDKAVALLRRAAYVLHVGVLAEREAMAAEIDTYTDGQYLDMQADEEATRQAEEAKDAEAVWRSGDG